MGVSIGVCIDAVAVPQSIQHASFVCTVILYTVIDAMVTNTPPILPMVRPLSGYVAKIEFSLIREGGREGVYERKMVTIEHI